MEATTRPLLQSPAVLGTIPLEAKATHRTLGPPAAAFSSLGTRAGFLLPDLLGLGAVALVLIAVSGLSGRYEPSIHLAPLAGMVLLAFGAAGLYRAECVHPAEELQVAGSILNLVFFAYAVPICAAPPLGMSRVVAGAELAAAWLLCLVAIPSLRAVARVAFSRTRWWGTAAVVIASGSSANRVIRTLRRWPELGLKPVGILHDQPGQVEAMALPSWGGTHLAPTVARTHDVPYAILAMPDLTAKELSERVRRYSHFFECVLVIPDLPAASALWTSNRRFDGLIGYGVRHSARRRLLQSLKRSLDWVCALGGLVLLSPVLIVIAVLVKLDSPGPVFFRQTRLGLDGECFTILKFRSMYVDAEARLQVLLDQDPARREEYRHYRKLRPDPRVTPLGRWLRLYSLDELPQLVNVVTGSLSLVGPRAYLPSELPAMGGLERSALQSRPGITGLWQVSGRNELPFAERLTMDVHYAHNWTPWLDLYILAKTLPVVVRGEGTG